VPGFVLIGVVVVTAAPFFGAKLGGSTRLASTSQIVGGDILQVEALGNAL